MESLSFCVGVIGNMISVLLFLSPMGTFWRIIKHRSTEEFESIPYVCTFLASAFWTYYGIIKPGEELVATVNGFGGVVDTVYLVLFLIFAPPRMRAKTAMLVGILDVGLLAVAIIVTQSFLHGNIKTDVIGFIGAGLNIAMYGSPLAVIKRVLTSKSVEYMPFLLSFMTFLNGGIWAFYAFLMKDWFLGVPNGVGFLLGAAQLALYAIYWKPKPNCFWIYTNNRSTSHDLEKNQQEEHLLPSPNTSS